MKLKIGMMVILLIGAGLIAISVIWVHPTIKDLSWKRISAAVLSTTVQPLGMDINAMVTVQDAEVHYSYFVKGNELTGRGMYHFPGSTKLALVADIKRIDILYNPAKPQESIIKRPFPAVAALFGLLGIVCIIVATTTAMLSRRHSSKRR